MKKDRDSHSQPYDEFSNQMAKLLSLLRKCLKNNKMGHEEINKIFGEMKGKNENLNLNVYFLTVMPFHPDDVDELAGEFEDLFDEEVEKDDQPQEDLRFELSSNDQEFLKKHGIKF